MAIPPGSRQINLTVVDNGRRSVLNLADWANAGFVLKKNGAAQASSVPWDDPIDPDYQHTSGAIRQRVLHETGSNGDYGTGECALIDANGDSATDLLYATDFAFIGLHEAAAATGDPELKQAEDRLADFLVRIQIRSETHPELDGAWYCGFDFAKWDYWGSEGDTGWGVWSIEAGWTQGWITAK